MTCLRCEGLVVHEKLKILTDSGRVVMSVRMALPQLWGHCPSRDCCTHAYHVVPEEHPSLPDPGR